MNTLLAISIGPVQDFIAAGRRLGDLTAGSSLLTKMAKTVAQSVHEQGGHLIFPADPNEDGPNKILAILTDRDASEVAASARAVAAQMLMERWEAVVAKLPAGSIDEELARQQIAQFLEFYAAWVPCPPGSYASARLRVDRLLAGRKALRDFKQPPTRAGQPKSPLDPSRECVLTLEANRTVSAALRNSLLRLNGGELLDAVSILKRSEGRRSKAPSTAAMAARSVLRACAPELVAALNDIAQAAGDDADIGDLLFDSQMDDLADETAAALQGRAAEISHLRREACRSAGVSSCSPYYAILVADGDRMGRMLAAMTTDDEHREFSKRLAQFAQGARRIVERHNGSAIYTGGDDVLALLPLVTAIPCAAELAAAFKEQMSSPGAGALEDQPSLSAGLAIVHFMEPLQVALGYARAAEKEAKRDRNSIAIALHTRGGAPVTVVNQWESDPAKVVDAWNAFADLQRHDELSRGFPYEMKQLVAEWPSDDTTKILDHNVLKLEVERILKRKKGGERSHATEQLYLKIGKFETKNEFADLADWLIIARFLTSNTPGREAVND